MARIRCTRCRSANVALLEDDINVKVKQQTSLNLNPLKPFTLTNTKVKKKRKKSAAKIGLGILTGGASLFATGTKKKAKREFFCRDCGTVFRVKK